VDSSETTTGSAGPASVDESTLILGESAPSASGDTANVSPFGFWDFARMILVLACVIGIIYLIFYFLKRAGSGKFAKSELIRVVGSQSLPGNRAVYLIQVGTQIFMVGAGGDSVTMLGEITDKETIDTMILAAAETDSEPKRSFGDLVGSLIRGNQDGSLDLMRQQRERLQRLRQ
jgi:flagellar protein FliO/FliZ